MVHGSWLKAHGSWPKGADPGAQGRDPRSGPRPSAPILTAPRPQRFRLKGRPSHPQGYALFHNALPPSTSPTVMNISKMRQIAKLSTHTPRVIHVICSDDPDLPANSCLLLNHGNESLNHQVFVIGTWTQSLATCKVAIANPCQDPLWENDQFGSQKFWYNWVLESRNPGKKWNSVWPAGTGPRWRLWTTGVEGRPHTLLLRPSWWEWVHGCFMAQCLADLRQDSHRQNHHDC